MTQTWKTTQTLLKARSKTNLRWIILEVANDAARPTMWAEITSVPFARSLTFHNRPYTHTSSRSIRKGQTELLLLPLPPTKTGEGQGRAKKAQMQRLKPQNPHSSKHSSAREDPQNQLMDFRRFSQRFLGVEMKRKSVMKVSLKN